jgi:transposase InsO family protein
MRQPWPIGVGQGLPGALGQAAWIEEYNLHRRHSSLGMLSPVAYERALAAEQKAA